MLKSVPAGKVLFTGLALLGMLLLSNASVAISQEVTSSSRGAGVSATMQEETYEVQIRSDQFYRDERSDLDDYQKERCLLDWYLPVGKKDFPVLVWFHGGGLRGGHKAGEHDVQISKFFASHGVAVASINYRLNPKAKYPAYVEDAAAAVAFVKHSAKEIGGDPDSVFVSGHSAGGYLTLMVALDSKLLAAHKLTPKSLAGYLPISGQTITHSTVRSELGMPEDQPIINEAAPAYHSKTATSPILCIAGDNDLAGRSEENRYLVAMLKASKHDAHFIEFEGRDHGTIANWIPRKGDEVGKSMLKFIDQYDSDK